jgi:hypothetical protein
LAVIDYSTPFFLYGGFSIQRRSLKHRGIQSGEVDNFLDRLHLPASAGARLIHQRKRKRVGSIASASDVTMPVPAGGASIFRGGQM